MGMEARAEGDTVESVTMLTIEISKALLGINSVSIMAF
jgi:hypothetical protein